MEGTKRLEMRKQELTEEEVKEQALQLLVQRRPEKEPQQDSIINTVEIYRGWCDPL